MMLCCVGEVDVGTVNEAVYAIFLYTHKHRATNYTKRKPVLRHRYPYPQRVVARSTQIHP